MLHDVAETIERLRSLGTDNAAVEVKRAAGGLPESVVPTLCAFANRPGGGMLLLGIDEAIGFGSVDVDAPALAKSLADAARQALDPPPQIDISVVDFEGRPIVAAMIDEVPVGSRPCRVRSGRHHGVWIRAFDGDYRASDLEEQAFYANRIPPTADREVVAEATVEDLDQQLVAAFLANRRRGASGSSRLGQMDDTDLLRATSVLVGDKPTLAGLLALGVFPQRLYPALHIRAVNKGSAGTGSAVRAVDAPRIEGPIPEMMDAAVRWVARSAPTSIVNERAGRVIDQTRWPLDAVRELIGNALLHRDLSWSRHEPVMLILSDEELVVRNPGGLFGIRLDELGTRGVTPARNATLIGIASHVQLPEGGRTVEHLATGIPTILADFERRSYPRPTFVDDAVRFTVICRRNDARRSIGIGVRAEILAVLSSEPVTVHDLAALTERHDQTVRRTLRDLVDEGMVSRTGGRGRPTTYRRSDLER